MDRSGTDALPLSRDYLQRVLPHREPFLFVDRITAVEPGRGAVGIKHVAPDRDANTEPYALWKSPALLLEMMAQVGAVGLLVTEGAAITDTVPMFTGIQRARFRGVASPGDTLTASVAVLKKRGILGWASGTVHTQHGALLCEATFSYVLMIAASASSGTAARLQSAQQRSGDETMERVLRERNMEREAKGD